MRAASALLALALLAAPARAQELELRWSRARAFVHEQVQLEATLVHPVGLNPRWEPPAFDGFVIERLPNEGGTMRRDVAGGYVRTTRLRHALFPTRSGVIEVAASRIVLVDAAGAESFLAVPQTRLSVESLPETGRPAGFDATVGELSARARLTPGAIALGEHASFEIDVFGFANVWDVAAPDLERALGGACEVFPETSRIDRAVRDEQLFARKTFRFSLVPRSAGRVAIPALAFAHFDPDQAAYRVASTDPVELEVAPTRAPAPAAATPMPEPAPRGGLLVWLPTLFLVASGAAAAVFVRRSAPSAPRPAPASAPSRPLPPRADPLDLLRQAEAALEEPAFGALLSSALRAACDARDASLTTSELAARIPDTDLVALLRRIDAERFSARPSPEQRTTLLHAAAAYLTSRPPRTAV